MIEIEILLLAIFMICITIYKRNWVPKRPPFFKNGELIKLGHRGAPSLAHENTLDSFRKAIKAGTDGVELDVQFSANKKLVVYHNWDIKNSSGEKKLIQNLSYSEIQKIHLNGSEKNKIPLFTDVLDILNKKCIINIEIKSTHFLNTHIEKSILGIGIGQGSWAGPAWFWLGPKGPGPDQLGFGLGAKGPGPDRLGFGLGFFR